MPNYTLKLMHRNHTKPNAEWLRCLQDTYTQRGTRSHKNQWARDEVTQLGVLYYRTWQMLPSSRRMDRAYCLPDATTIYRLFGTIEAYHTAITAACAGEGSHATTP